MAQGPGTDTSAVTLLSHSAVTLLVTLQCCSNVCHFHYFLFLTSSFPPHCLFPCFSFPTFCVLFHLHISIYLQHSSPCTGAVYLYFLKFYIFLFPSLYFYDTVSVWTEYAASLLKTDLKCSFGRMHVAEGELIYQ